MSDFQQYGLCDALNTSLQELRYEQATDTQQACLPDLLKGIDVAVEAKTGSGKTLAFGLTLLNKLAQASGDAQHPHAMVLCPTRELAEQVTYQLQLLARRMANTKILALFGGVAIAPQLSSLRHAPAVVVGTPGRIMDILSQGRMDLSGVKTLVLDEADRMLDMGFSDQVDWILKKLNQNARDVQTLLFSATFGGKLKTLSQTYQQNAKMIVLDDAHTRKHIEQIAYKVQPGKREYAVSALLTELQAESAIVFCQTKVEVSELTQTLAQEGFDVVQLQGDMEQSKRSEALMLFSTDCANVLVATDVASRGLDIADVGVVINYRISDDLDIHTHRIGRTGRAGEKGLALTLIDDKDEVKLVAFNSQLKEEIPIKGAQALRFHANRIKKASFVGLQIDGGKKQKLSKGDILGALTKQAYIPGKDIGKIHVGSHKSFVAMKIRSLKRALAFFREDRVKGKKVKVRKL